MLTDDAIRICPIKDDQMEDRVPREQMSAGEFVTLAQQADFDAFSAATSSSAPGRRVLSVDAAMEAARAILWPDPKSEPPTEVEASDVARAHEYQLLAMLLTRAPDAATL